MMIYVGIEHVGYSEGGGSILVREKDATSNYNECQSSQDERIKFNWKEIAKSILSKVCTCFIQKANELVLLAHDVYRFMSFLLCSKNSLVSSSPSEQPFSGCKNDLLPSLLST